MSESLKTVVGLKIGLCETDPLFNHTDATGVEHRCVSATLSRLLLIPCC